jgi:hypothetical protein
VHLFDSFMGLSTPDRQIDRRYEAGWMKSEEAALRTAIYNLHIEEYCRIHAGWFADTLPRVCDSQSFCFAHVDCDLYAPTKLCLQTVFPRLPVGGVVVVDDYYDASGGVQRAVDEQASEMSEPIFIGPAPQAMIFRSKLRYTKTTNPLSASFDFLKQHKAYISYLSMLRDTIRKADEDTSSVLSLLSSSPSVLPMHDSLSVESEQLVRLLT